MLLFIGRFSSVANDCIGFGSLSLFEPAVLLLSIVVCTACFGTGFMLLYVLLVSGRLPVLAQMLPTSALGCGGGGYHTDLYCRRIV